MRLGKIPRKALAALGCLALAGLTACGSSTPPNLVLVTLDTTRADHLGPYGYEGAHTPQLERFASRAVVYDRAYATSSWTLPSHASLFTGLYPMEHGARAEGPDVGRPLADAFDTLAERLARAGYRTAGVVAGPVLSRALGVAQGFEHYDDDFSIPEWAFAGKRAAYVADRAIELVERFGDEPFFLFVNFFDPHAPYRPPPPFDRGLAPADHREVALALFEHLEAGDAPRPVAELPERERALLAALRAGYDAEIAYMDHHLGRLLAAIEASPRADETLVAITGDHGESFGEHYFLSHGAHLYEHNVHVPLLVRHPGGHAAGTRVAAPVENRRLFAWLLRAAGVAVPEEVETHDGDAAVLAEVQRSALNVRLFGEYFDRDLRAVYVPPHKLIRDSTGRVELFDLTRDPEELHDLAGSQPDLARRLVQHLDLEIADHPARYDRDADTQAELAPETEEALRGLGYLE